MVRVTLQRPSRASRRKKLAARKSVVDRQDKSAPYFCGDGFYPIQSRQVDFSLVDSVAGVWHAFQSGTQAIVSDRQRHELKPSLRFRHEFFLPLSVANAPDQARRHCIEQFVREMDAAELRQRVQRLPPLRLAGKIPHRLLLPRFQNRERFNHAIAERRKKLRLGLPESLEHIFGKIAVVRALFNDRELFGTIEDAPHLRELRGQDSPKNRAHADVGEIVTLSSYLAPARAVVTEVRM